MATIKSVYRKYFYVRFECSFEFEVTNNLLANTTKQGTWKSASLALNQNSPVTRNLLWNIRKQVYEQIQIIANKTGKRHETHMR
jgi:DNA gyrase/topoisomerase IV subunit A